MNKTITSMIKIKEKFDILKDYLNHPEKNYKDIPEKDTLSKDEIKLLLSTNAVPLHSFRGYFIEENFDEEMFILSLKASINSAQYIPPHLHTKATTKIFLENATSREFPGTLNPSLISDEDFFLFVEKNYKNVREIITGLQNNFFTNKKEMTMHKLNDEAMTEEEKYSEGSSGYDRNETTYELVQRFRNDFLRLLKVMLKQDKSFDLITRMPNEIYPELTQFIEENILEFIENKNIVLDNIPNDCQSKRIVDFAVYKDIVNVNYANPEFITTTMVEKMLEGLISGDITNMADFANKIQGHDEILTKAVVEKIFKMKSKTLFDNISYLIKEDNLTDTMIFYLLQSTFNNFVPDEIADILRRRVTIEQVNLIINKKGIDKLPELEEFIPTEMYQEIYNTEELSEITIQQMGGVQLKNIVKEKQTKRLFLLAINHPDYPLTESELMTYMEDINPEFISTDLISKKLSSSTTFTNTFIKDYLFPNLKDYTINLKMARHSSLWQFINPKFINDEKIVLNMLLSNGDTEEINQIITEKSNIINKSQKKQ